MAEEKLPDIIPLGGSNPIADEFETVFDPASGSTVVRRRSSRAGGAAGQGQQIVGKLDAIAQGVVRDWQGETKADLAGDFAKAFSLKQNLERLAPLTPDEEQELSTLKSTPPRVAYPSGPYMAPFNQGDLSLQRRTELERRKNAPSMVAQVDMELQRLATEIQEVQAILDRNQGVTAGAKKFNEADGFWAKTKAFARSPLDVSATKAAESAYTGAKISAISAGVAAGTIASGGTLALGSGLGLASAGAMTANEGYDQTLLEELIKIDPSIVNDPKGFLEAYKKNPADYRKAYEEAKSNALKSGLAQGTAEAATAGLLKFIPPAKTAVGRFLADQAGEQAEELSSLFAERGVQGQLPTGGELADTIFSTAAGTAAQNAVTSAGGYAIDKSGIKGAISEAMRPRLQVDLDTLIPLGQPGQEAQGAQPTAAPGIAPLQITPGSIVPFEQGGQQAAAPTSPTAQTELPDVIPLPATPTATAASASDQGLPTTPQAAQPQGQAQPQQTPAGPSPLSPIAQQAFPVGQTPRAPQGPQLTPAPAAQIPSPLAPQGAGAQTPRGGQGPQGPNPLAPQVAQTQAPQGQQAAGAQAPADVGSLFTPPAPAAPTQPTAQAGAPAGGLPQAGAQAPQAGALPAPGAQAGAPMPGAQPQGQTPQGRQRGISLAPPQPTTAAAPTSAPRNLTPQEQTAWANLERKAAELDRRREARRQQQGRNTNPDTRNRGPEQIAMRLINELRSGGTLTLQEANGALRIVEKLMENGYLDNLAVSVSNAQRGAGVRGDYNPVKELVQLFVRNTNRPGVFKRTFAHEVSHHLERMVPAKDLEAARQQFLRERAKWLSDKKGIRALLGDGNWLDRSFTNEQIRDFLAKNQMDPALISKYFIRDTNTGRWRIKLTDETYRYTNFSEYFAEKVAQIAGDRDDNRANNQANPGVWAKIRGMLAQIKKAMIEVFGRDEVEAIWDKFQQGEYSAEFQRDELQGYDKTGGQNPVQDNLTTADYRTPRVGPADAGRQGRVENIDKLEPNRPLSARDESINIPAEREQEAMSIAANIFSGNTEALASADPELVARVRELVQEGKDRAAVKYKQGARVKSDTKWRIGKRLSEENASRGMGVLDMRTVEGRITMASAIATEVEHHQSEGKTDINKDWYAESVARTKRIANKLLNGALDDPGNETAFLLIFSLTSNGQTIEANTEIGTHLTRKFLETGKFSNDFVGGGARRPQIIAALQLADRVFNALGKDKAKMREFLNTKFNPDDVYAELEKLGFTSTPEGKKRWWNWKLTVAREVGSAYGSAIFGPKLGGEFYQNMRGNKDATTKDTWFSRAFYRIKGDLTAVNSDTIVKNIERLIAGAQAEGYAIPKAVLADANRTMKAIRSGKFDPNSPVNPEGPLMRFASERLKAYTKSVDPVTKKGFADKTEVNLASKSIVENSRSFKEAPDAGDRSVMDDVSAMAREMLKAKGIDIASDALQAEWWGSEKALYDHLGQDGALNQNETFDLAMEKLYRDTTGNEYQDDAGPAGKGPQRAVARDGGSASQGIAKPDAKGSRGPREGSGEGVAQSARDEETYHAGKAREQRAQLKQLQSELKAKHAAVREAEGSGRGYDLMRLREARQALDTHYRKMDILRKNIEENEMFDQASRGARTAQSARDDGENTPIPGGYREAFFKARQGAGAPEPKQIKFWTDLGHDPDADTTKQFLWSIDRRGQMHVISVSDLNDKMAAAGANDQGDVISGPSDGLSDWARIPTHLDWGNLAGEYDRTTGKDLGIPRDVLSGPAHGRIDATGDVVRVSLYQGNQSTPEIKADMQRHVKEKLGEALGQDPEGLRGYDFTDAGPFTGPEVFSARDEEGPQRLSLDRAFPAEEDDAEFVPFSKRAKSLLSKGYKISIRNKDKVRPSVAVVSPNGEFLAEISIALRGGKNGNPSVSRRSKEFPNRGYTASLMAFASDLLSPRMSRIAKEIEEKQTFESVMENSRRLLNLARQNVAKLDDVVIVETQDEANARNSRSRIDGPLHKTKEEFEFYKEAMLRQLEKAQDDWAKTPKTQAEFDKFQSSRLAKRETDIKAARNGDHDAALVATFSEVIERLRQVGVTRIDFDTLDHGMRTVDLIAATERINNMLGNSDAEGDIEGLSGYNPVPNIDNVKVNGNLFTALQVAARKPSPDAWIDGWTGTSDASFAIDPNTAYSARDEETAGPEFTTPGGELTNHGDKALAKGGFLTREALRIPANLRDRFSLVYNVDSDGSQVVQIKFEGKAIAQADFSAEEYETGKGLTDLKMIEVTDKFKGLGLSTILQAEVHEMGKRATPAVDTMTATVLDPAQRPLKSMRKLLGKDNVDITEDTLEEATQDDAFGFQDPDGNYVRRRMEVQGNVPQYTPEQRQLIKDMEAARAAGNMAKAGRLKARFDKSVKDNGTQILSARDEEGDYRGSHRAPDGTNGEGSLDAMDRTYPDDIYGPKGAQYYGARRADDVKIHKLIQSVRGKPDAMVTVYRAVPKGVATEITPGNWVTPSRDYAAEHGERFKDGFDIIERQVRAGDLFTEGNSLQEFGWNPTGESIQSARDEDGENTVIPGGKREEFLKKKPAARPQYYTEIGHDPANAENSYLFMVDSDGVMYVKRVSDLKAQITENYTLNEETGVYDVPGKTYGMDVNYLTHSDWEDVDNQFENGIIRQGSRDAIAFGRIEVKDGKPYIAVGGQGDVGSEIALNDGRREFRSIIRDAAQSAIDSGEISNVTQRAVGLDYSFVDGGDTGKPAVFSRRDEDTPVAGSRSGRAGLVAGAMALAPTTVQAATGAAKAGATIAGVAAGDLIGLATGIALTSTDRPLRGLNPIAANMHLLANDTKSPTMTRIANMFGLLGGNTSAGAQETYHDSRDSSRRIFRNKLAAAFEPLAKLSQDQIRALDVTIARALAGEIPMPSGAVGQVVQNLRALSDELYNHLREAGVDVNYAQDYAIPHSFNAEAVAKDEQAFIDKAEQAYIRNNPERIRTLTGYIAQIAAEAKANGWTSEMRDRSAALQAEIDKLRNANPRQQAEDLAAAILSGEEGGDQSQGLILGSNPQNQNKADFLKSRVFESAARAMLREYFHNDARHAWNNYIARATTISEFTRRFGKDGEKWNKMVEQLRAEKVSNEDITRIKELVLDAMGALTPAARGGHAMANALLGLSNMSKLKSTFLTNFLEAQAQAIPGGLLDTVTAPVVMLKEFAAVLAELSPRQRALLKRLIRIDLNTETGNMELARIVGLMDASGVHQIMENSAYNLDRSSDFREDSRTDRAARGVSNVTSGLARAYGIEASENAKRAMGARYASGRLDQYVSELIRDNIIARALAKVGYTKDTFTTKNEARMRLRRAGVSDADMAAFTQWWEKARASGKFNEMLADSTDPMAAMARRAIRMESSRAMVNSNRAMKPGGERNKAISQDNFWGKAVMSFLNYPAAFREQVAKPMGRDIRSGVRGFESEGGESTFFSPAERARMIAKVAAIPAMAVSAAAFLALRTMVNGDDEDKEELQQKSLFSQLIDGLSYTGFLGGKTEAVQRARRGQLPPIVDEAVRLGKNLERESTKSNGKERAVTKSVTRSIGVPALQVAATTTLPMPLATVVDQALASKAFTDFVVDTVAGPGKPKSTGYTGSGRESGRETGRSGSRSDGR